MQHTHIHTHTYTHTCPQTYKCTDMYIDTYMQLFIHTHTYTYVYIHVHANKYIPNLYVQERTLKPTYHPFFIKLQYIRLYYFILQTFNFSFKSITFSLLNLFSDSLGGNSKTIMVATIRTDNEYYQQTSVTLKYAFRAKKVRTYVMLCIVKLCYVTLLCMT